MIEFPHQVAWRRSGARCHYAGQLSLDEGALVLTGREPSTGVEVVLRIPDYAVRAARAALNDQEAVVGVGGYVLELADAVPLLIRPVGVGPLLDGELAEALAGCLHRPVAARSAA
jgi:hypothetical protein